MPTFDSSSDSLPIPARLVERALDLARAEAGLALVHTRRIAVRAVSALLGTIVACAFAQLAVVLLVAWPVIAPHVPTLNLVAGVGISVTLALAGAGAAFVVWSGASDKRPAAAAGDAATRTDTLRPRASASIPPSPVSDTASVRNGVVSGQRRFDTREEPAAATLAERVG